MSLRIIYSFFVLALGCYIFLGSSSGAGLVQGQDRTGGPLAAGFCGNNGCHASGAFNPSVSITLLDNDVPTENYLPGTTYTIRVEITAGDGEPAAYGFQLVALDANDAGVGTLNPSANSQTLELNGVTYIEQNAPNEDNNFFEFEWIAPDDSAGDITFYTAGNAVNRNSSPTGDGAAITSLTVSELDVAIFNVEPLPIKLQIHPNPIQEYLNIFMESDISGDVQLNVFDLSGKVLIQKELSIAIGSTSFRVDASNWNKGTYIVQLTDDQKTIAQKIIK